MYYWRGGVMWKQNTLIAGHNVFFGTQFTASILVAFNDQMAVKKVFMALAYQASTPWGSNTTGDVETDTISSQTFLKQQSRIMVQDYNTAESPNMYVAFNRDTNSLSNTAVSLWEGSYLCGHYIVVRLRHGSSAGNYLFSPYIIYENDPRNF